MPPDYNVNQPEDTTSMRKLLTNPFLGVLFLFWCIVRNTRLALTTSSFGAKVVNSFLQQFSTF
jgi:hypothetical protein